MPKRRMSPLEPQGTADPSRPGGLTGFELAATALSILWLGVTAAVFLGGGIADETGTGGTGRGSLEFMMILIVVFGPVAMIWVGATAARASRVMRHESQRLQAAIDAIRRAYIAQSQAHAVNTEPTVAKKLDEIAAAQRKTENALAMFSSSRATAAPVSPPAPALAAAQTPASDDQVALPLGTPAEDLTPPLAHVDFIRALNFPETAEDKEGFAALRRALKDRRAAQLIQASQDVLTLLSQDGIYMDDLRPDMARPEIWRRFAAGERGRQIATLGGIRDRSSLALTAARMRADPIFRDAAHHFLRKFDKIFAEFSETASDAEISTLSETRTARAFMLVGRVAGTFD